MMESINVVIHYYSATKMVESKDSDIFENWGSNENVMVDGDSLSPNNPSQSPQTNKDEEIEPHLPKYAKGSHSTKNIISEVEVRVESICKISGELELHMLYSS